MRFVEIGQGGGGLQMGRKRWRLGREVDATEDDLGCCLVVVIIIWDGTIDAIGIVQLSHRSGLVARWVVFVKVGIWPPTMVVPRSTEAMVFVGEEEQKRQDDCSGQLCVPQDCCYWHLLHVPSRDDDGREAYCQRSNGGSCYEPMGRGDISVWRFGPYPAMESNGGGDDGHEDPLGGLHDVSDESTSHDVLHCGHGSMACDSIVTCLFIRPAFSRFVKAGYM